MAFVECPSSLQQHVWQQVQLLHSTQTAPYEVIVADYAGCLQRKRDLEVRVGVLEREKAELDDRVGALETSLAATDKLAAQDFATKAEAYKNQLQRANSEITTLLRDKNHTLEELLSLRRQVDSLKSTQDEAQQQAELLKEETAGLKERLSCLSKALDDEKAARTLAAAEAESRVAAKVAAEAEAERLRADNLGLEACLRKMMEKEADQLRKISEMHEEMMANQTRQQNEAGAASQLLGLLTRRRGCANPGSTPSAGTSTAATPSRRRSSTELPAALTPAAAAAAAKAAGAAGAAGAAADSSSQQQQQQSGPGQQDPHGTQMWASLKQKMGLPEGPVHAPERHLPTAPVKTTQAHPGGVISLEFERPGHLLATCGADKTVQTWDLNTNGHVTTFHGLGGSANEVSFTCDSRRLLGAGADKRLIVWNTLTGQVLHTLTGHSDAVSCVACSPLDETTAVSTGEDRCIKVWDLAKGFSKRGLLYPKMPTALTFSADGQTIITGHLDGTMCLWDLRQNKAGGQPLAEVRDHAGAILCVRPSPHPDRLLTAAKDNSLRLWDFRQLGTVQLFKAPHFTIGSTGSMRSSRCHAEISADGRFVAAGAADGQVYVWDLKPQQQQQQRPGQPHSVAAAAAAAMKAQPVVRTLKHHKEAVVAAGWSSNCCQLVSADKAGNIAFWQCPEV